ncbi:hypothetical protein [Streptomyces sp. NPDC020298]|uniref:hypothetical protein n=1 Tax=unclassified Streptomyces TaxID=2593676 RepID=UPI0033E22D8E
MDMIVFAAVLATGVLLTAIGVSANSLATISVALSGLYGAWTGSARSSRTPPSQPQQGGPVPEGEDDGP